MTKLILFFTSLFFSIGVLFAQNEAALTLRVDKAGSLRSLLSDEQYAKTSKIIDSGEINTLDIKTLQEMSEEKGSLQSIDLSKANIVAYEESKTFSTLPMPTLAFGASQDEIKAYEAAHNGTYNEERSNPEEGLHALMWFDVASDEISFRCYFVSKNGAGEFDEFWGFYPQIEYATQPKGESFALTEAFIQLLAASGFSTPQSLGEDGFVATNKEKNLDIMINLTKLSEITEEEGDKKVLVLMFAPAGNYMENEG